MARKQYRLNISSINSAPNAWLTNFDPNNVQAGGGSLNIGNNPNQPLISEPLNPTSPTQFNVTLTTSDISQLPLIPGVVTFPPILFPCGETEVMVNGYVIACHWVF